MLSTQIPGLCCRVRSFYYKMQIIFFLNLPLLTSLCEQRSDTHLSISQLNTFTTKVFMQSVAQTFS